MNEDLLERAAREAGGRVVAALAARFRDLDVAEEAFGEACLQAAETWGPQGAPRDPAAWLYRVAERRALDALRRRRTRRERQPETPAAEPTAEDLMADDRNLVPDERLRLIFVCCHPAVAVEGRVALTLRLICGLTTGEIARAFLVPDPTMAQRLSRAKRKIAEAGIGFEVPGPEDWPDRLDAVLSTLEVAYSRAHEDAAGTGAHAGYAREMLTLTTVLATMLPQEPDVHALAAVVRYAEARRPARVDDGGVMVPLSEQDPALWDRRLIRAGDDHAARAVALAPHRPRVLQAALQAAWCSRRPGRAAPWRRVLELYDRLLQQRDDGIVRLNRAVALAEVAGPAAALAEVDGLTHRGLPQFLPYHAVRADLLRRLGRPQEARAAYDAALALDPAEAERRWLRRQRGLLPDPRPDPETSV